MPQIIFNVSDELLGIINEEVEERKKREVGYNRTMLMLEAVQKELGMNARDRRYLKGNRVTQYTIEELTSKMVEGESYSLGEMMKLTGMSRGTAKSLADKHLGTYFELEDRKGPYMYIFLNPDNVENEKPAKKSKRKKRRTKQTKPDVDQTEWIDPPKRKPKTDEQIYQDLITHKVPFDGPMLKNERRIIEEFGGELLYRELTEE